jgi:hypothetical protein
MMKVLPFAVESAKRYIPAELGSRRFYLPFEMSLNIGVIGDSNP